MLNISGFINQFLIMEYSPNSAVIYCLISKIEDDKIHLSVTKDFEKTGLLEDDVVKCRLSKEQTEYYFDAKIHGVELKPESLNLIINPISEVEQFINVRTDMRINLRFVAFTNENNLASIINVSKSGILLSSKIFYAKGDKVKVKLLISYPSSICNFIGEITRVHDNYDGKKEYGIKIIQFRSSEEAKIYTKFINELVKAFEPI